MFISNVETLWAGTEQSLYAALKAEEGIIAKLAAGIYPSVLSSSGDDEDEDVPYLYSRQGNVGVITIKGSLVNTESCWNKYDGLVSYEAIREAIMYGANDSKVGQLFMDIASGGGAVSGVMDTAKLINMVSKQMKTITAYTDSTMASAAYWLGCSASKVFCTLTSMVGSIGVLSTHMERSKELADRGIGVTVIRSGPYKALANSVEPLSPEGKETLQKMVDAVASVFDGFVGDMRGKTASEVNATMGQGREFMGAAAVDVGLADGITSYDALISKLEAEAIDSQSVYNNNGNRNNQGYNMKQALTQQQIAAAAAGGVALSADEIAKSKAEAELAVKAKAEADAQAKDQAEKLAAESDTGVTEEAKGLNAGSELVGFLSAQVKEKDLMLTANALEIASLKAKSQEAEATHSELLKIAITATNNMRIATNCAAIDFSAQSAVSVLASHKAAESSFKDHFKVGGVASVDSAAAAVEESKKVVDSSHMDRVRAAGG